MIPDHYKNLWILLNEILPDSQKETADAERVFCALIKKYSEPHRQYHNVAHLEYLAAEFEKHREKFGLKTKSVIATLLFHDVVYDCVPGEDEKQSAVYMRQALSSLGVEEFVLDDAYKAIIATANHQSDEDWVLLFLDMDMSILAAEESVYDEYARGVCVEFCTQMDISEEFFKQARRERFLEPVFSAKCIFKTAAYRPMNERALANIQREMKQGL